MIIQKTNPPKITATILCVLVYSLLAHLLNLFISFFSICFNLTEVFSLQLVNNPALPDARNSFGNFLF